MAIVITTTSDDAKELESIAKILVDQKLAACCQIVGPIKSIYQWECAIEESEEWMCLIKSTQSRFAEIESVIQEHHHYDLPEIIATEIVGGSSEYLKWVEGC